MLVKEIMNREIVYISPETSIKEIFKIMINLDVIFVPVLDSNKVIVGYVNVKTLLSRMKLYNPQKTKEDVQVHFDHHEFIREQRLLYGNTAKDIMETDIISVDENMNIVDVVEFMLTKNIFRIPVSRKDKIVGCITWHDVLAALYKFEESRKLEEIPVTDEELKFKVFNAIKRNLDVHASKLNVRVKDGNVFIEGSVAGLEGHKAAEEIVNSIPGVKSVSNSMIIEQILE